MTRQWVLLLALLLPAARPARAQSAYEQLQMLTDALNLVRGNYVDSVAYGKLSRAAINGILRSLDPHSYFLPASDFAQLVDLEAGKLTSAGLSLTELNGRVHVLSVLPQGPAERAGIMAGDRLLAVNDTPTVGSHAAELEVRMSGSERKRLVLTLERGAALSPDTFRLQLRTEKFPDLSVTDARVLPYGVGYVRLSQFGENAGKEVENAIQKLGTGKTGVIIDLRNNPGGRILAAVEVAQLFLPRETVIFRTDGRKADADTTHRTKRNGPFQETPLVLLIDRGTASAAEALAVSLQDHQRARLVGRRTFGKALVQAPFFLKTGDVMWLTIARVYSPKGRLIQREYGSLAPEAYSALSAADSTKGGVLPDLAVAAAHYPAWWSRAAAAGTMYAVADSVAATLPNTSAGRSAWATAVTDWPERLLPPLFARLQDSAPHAGEGINADMRTSITRLLAGRAAEVRWGVDAAQDLLLASDPDVRAALTLLRSP